MTVMDAIDDNDNQSDDMQSQQLDDGWRGGWRQRQQWLQIETDAMSKNNNIMYDGITM
jgi:hypothetical protein